MAVAKKTTTKRTAPKPAPKKAAPTKAPAKKPAPKPAQKKDTAKPVTGELVTMTSPATLPAAADNSALANDDELRIIAQRITTLQIEHKDWDMPVRNQKPLFGADLDAWLMKKEDQAAKSMLERGVGYKLKKRELGHGAFQGWTKDKGLSVRAVQESMQVANLVMGLSEENARRAAALPQRKLAALAVAPVKMIDDLFDSGALNDADELSRDELRELIKLRKEVANQDEREAQLNKIIADQDEELRKRRALPEPNRHALELRRAVVDETEALRANAHTLQAVMDKIALLPAGLERSELDAIIHPLMYALQGLHATATKLFQQGHQQFAFHTDIDVMPPQLSAEELARASVQHTEFLAAAERRAIDRQLDLSIQNNRGRKSAK